MSILQEEVDKYTQKSVQENCQEQQYEKSDMQVSNIMDGLRKAGCRITRQRKIILDIILQEECACCKEVYFLASKKDPNIGMATVYRMINLLEETGALKRKHAYRICDREIDLEFCNVHLDDHTKISLDNERFHKVVEKGLESCGYLHARKVKKISVSEKIFQ